MDRGRSGGARPRPAASVGPDRRRSPGDRFVMRRFSPVETIGGGIVLDPLCPRLCAGGSMRLARRSTVSRRDRRREARRPGSRRRRERAPARRPSPARGRLDAKRSARRSRSRWRGRIHALRRSPERYIGETALARLAGARGAEIRALVESGAAPSATSALDASPAPASGRGPALGGGGRDGPGGAGRARSRRRRGALPGEGGAGGPRARTVRTHRRRLRGARARTRRLGRGRGAPAPPAEGRRRA